LPSIILLKKTDSFFSTSIGPASRKNGTRRLSAKGAKGQQPRLPAMHRSTGELKRGSAVKKTALARRVALWCLFFETLLSTKGVCSETVGATCAAGSSARHSHRIFACTCRNRTSARAPRPESTASRAEHIVGEEKVRIFLFWNTCRGVHTRVQQQRRAGVARAAA